MTLTLTPQKPCQYNNKFDCSETNGYNIPQGAINAVLGFFNNITLERYFVEKNINSIYSIDRIIYLNTAEPRCY